MTTTLPRSRAAMIASALGAVLLLAGCSAASAASNVTPTPQASGAAQPAGRGGVSGEIAAMTGTTLQVQDTSAQTTVTYSASTTVSKRVATTLSAVTVGSCVVAMTGTPGSSTSGSSSTSSAVTSVAISAAVDGACTAVGGGGMGQGGGAGAPTGAPQAQNGQAQSGQAGAPTGAPGGGTFTPPTSGKVTAVSGSTITVATTAQGSTASTSKKIVVASATTYTTTAAATTADIAVGECVAVQGTASQSGAVTATSLTLSTKGASGCSTGFGGGRPNAGGTGA